MRKSSDDRLLAREMGVRISGGNENDFSLRKHNAASATDSFGHWIYQYTKLPLLSHEETSELAKKAQKGDRKALDKIVRHSSRLALWYALHCPLPPGIEFDDIVQEALIGITEAAIRFDPENHGGCTFSTYAFFWMFHHVHRFVSQKVPMIRLPENAVETCRYVDQIREGKYKQTSNEIVDIQFLSDLTYRSEKRLRLLINASETEIVSLEETDEPVTEEDYVFNQLLQPLLNEALGKIFETLPERTVRIVKMRYGLDGYPEMSFREIAEIFNRTGTRIGVIHQEAMRMMRHPKRSRHLSGF